MPILRDSGWGGGNNVGGITRLRREGELPFGIREVRAWAHGFIVSFTVPCDRAGAARPESYVITAYRRIWKGTYATPDQDRHQVAVEAAEVSEDARQVRLRVSALKPGFLYEVHVRPPAAPGAGPLWPPVAYYTLNAIPQGDGR